MFLTKARHEYPMYILGRDLLMQVQSRLYEESLKEVFLCMMY